MKLFSRVFSAAALIGAAAMIAVKYAPPVPTAVGSVRSGQAAGVALRAAEAEAATATSGLVAQGQLWETVATSARGRACTTLPVAAGAFREAQSLPVGSALRIVLSPQMPVLAAAISGRWVAEDGTTITQVRVAGKIPGTLTLQANVASAFFLGQLYYDGLAVAYDFRATGEGLSATRHQLSDLLCAFVAAREGTIEGLGLPPLDQGRARAAEAEEKAVKAKNLLQEGKASGGGAAATPGLRVNDVTVAEGNSGSRDLTFTVKLSKADNKNIITVMYTTADDTAAAGADYTAVSGMLSFPKGSTTQTVAVPVMGDTVLEATETFSLNLSSPVKATLTDASGVGTISDDDAPAPTSTVPVRNSLPGATAVIYLDMDGQVVSGTQWASGATITARGISSAYTQAQMAEIWQRVAEDYAPFQVNVTTQESVYQATAANRRVRCIITPDNEWYGTAGGVAYVGSFTWTGDTPCWVFSDQLANTARYIAEACAHEVGHTMGLSHDGRISPSEAYYAGHGTGDVGWAPIMGVGYYKLLVQWSKGEYLSANNVQDDLAIITSRNGFGYRSDQVADTAAAATALTVSGTTIAGAGIIETPGDVDVFAFATTGGAVTLHVGGDAASQDLDLLAEIKDASGNSLAASNPDSLTDASISTSLPAGTYFLHVSGVGRGDFLVDGYTDYGSLGQYTIGGTVP